MKLARVFGVVVAAVMVPMGCSSFVGCGSDKETDGGPAETGGSSGAGAGGAVGGASGSAGGSSGVGVTDGAVGGGGGGGLTDAGGPVPGPVASPGQQCPTSGELACAGDFTKLTIVCNGDVWAPLDTCTATQACDSRPSLPTTGTCMEQDPACLDKTLHYRFCSGNALMECGTANLEVVKVEDCALACFDGECRTDTDPCPTGIARNCDLACGTPQSDCNDCRLWIGTREYLAVSTVRTPPFDQACSCATPGARFLALEVLTTIAGFYPPIKISVSAPWWIVDWDGSWPPTCDKAQAAQCVVETGQDYDRIIVATDDPNALGRNIKLEQASGLSCP